MTRFARLRRIIILLSILFLLDISLIVMMIPVRTFLTWGVVAVQGIVVAYFIAIAVGLIKEAELHEHSSDTFSKDSEQR